MRSAAAANIARFTRRDFAEIALGGSIMAFPAATTEEIWNLGAELSLGRVLLFGLASLVVLAVLMYGLHHRQVTAPDRAVFFKRLGATYAATLVISAALLYGVDRFEPWQDLLTALRRMILVAFPASFAATVVDNLGSAIDPGRS